MALTTFGRIVKIIDYVIDNSKKVVDWFKGLWRSHREKKIEDAVNKLDVGGIKRFILRIRQKRQERRDRS